jgi:hypothetical protein
MTRNGDGALTEALAGWPDLLAARAKIRKEEAEGHWSMGGGVSTMLPVPNRNQANVAAAFAETQAAERREELAVLTIRQGVTAAFARYEAAMYALEMYAHGVRDIARQNLEVIRKANQLGRGSLLEVIAEQRRYIEVEMGYIEALQHAYNAVIDIGRRSPQRPSEASTDHDRQRQADQRTHAAALVVRYSQARVLERIHAAGPDRA